MEVNFKHNPAKPVEPIYIEQVFAEKPGGGLVANPAFDVPPTTAVGKSGNQFVAIKAYKLYAAVAAADTSIKIKKGTTLYQAKEASASAAEPLAAPEYVTGNWVYANEGDQLVRLINGANLRKETVNIAPEVVALLPTIKLV